MEDANDPTRDVPVRTASPSARPSTLLLVDDEPDILESLGLVLRACLPDIRVLKALSGPQALGLMQARKVGAILTDFRMPGMDGFEFLAQARQLDPDVPAIMMTAHPGVELVASAQLPHRLSLILTKPFDMESLVAILRSAFAGEPLATAGAPPMAHH